MNLTVRFLCDSALCAVTTFQLAARRLAFLCIDEDATTCDNSQKEKEIYFRIKQSEKAR
jgi:hypothetical protein